MSHGLPAADALVDLAFEATDLGLERIRRDPVLAPFVLGIGHDGDKVLAPMMGPNQRTSVEMGRRLLREEQRFRFAALAYDGRLSINGGPKLDALYVEGHDAHAAEGIKIVQRYVRKWPRRIKRVGNPVFVEPIESLLRR